MITIVFFNNKGGVGKTSLVYHLSWMYAELGLRVIASDFDPQANLTSMFLDEDRIEEIWPEGEHPESVLGAIEPILSGTGDIQQPHIEIVSENAGLIIGDLGLSRFEDKLSDAWPRCHDRDLAAFRAMSSFYRILDLASKDFNAEVVLIDVGPNLGAINRAAIIAADFVTIPLAPDLYSLQGLRNLGPTLKKWREEWKERLTKNPKPELTLPRGDMLPIGYVILQHAVRSDRPVKAYEKWMNRIPGEYRQNVLSGPPEKFQEVTDDKECLALLKHYRSLMPMAMEVRKPMFYLKPSDGAIGSHSLAVQDCFQDFKSLAVKIADRCGISVK
jgi:chromosome partitioning protein